MNKRVNRKELAEKMRAANEESQRKAKEAFSKRLDNHCPQCDSENISGLMHSFFVRLSNGEPVGQWRDWESNTELGPQRSCCDCGHEWDGEEDQT